MILLKHGAFSNKDLYRMKETNAIQFKERYSMFCFTFYWNQRIASFLYIMYKTTSIFIYSKWWHQVICFLIDRLYIKQVGLLLVTIISCKSSYMTISTEDVWYTCCFIMIFLQGLQTAKSHKFLYIFLCCWSFVLIACM